MSSRFAFPPPPPAPPKRDSGGPPPSQRGGRGGQSRGSFRGRGSRRGRGGQHQNPISPPNLNYLAPFSHPTPNTSRGGMYMQVPNVNGQPFVSNQPAYAQFLPQVPPHSFPQPWESTSQLPQMGTHPAQRVAKSEERRGHHNRKRSQTSNSGSQGRPAAAPSVPSFGAPIPTFNAQPTQNDGASQSTARSRKKRKKNNKKQNQLGLTPNGDVHEDSGDEDDDEEAGLAALFTGPLSVTHNGKKHNLTSPAEIRAWIEERKKNFPTKARLEEKKKQSQARKRQRDEEIELINEDRKRLRAQRAEEDAERKAQQQPAKELQQSQGKKKDSRSEEKAKGKAKREAQKQQAQELQQLQDKKRRTRVEKKQPWAAREARRGGRAANDRDSRSACPRRYEPPGGWDFTKKEDQIGSLEVWARSIGLHNVTRAELEAAASHFDYTPMEAPRDDNPPDLFEWTIDVVGDPHLTPGQSATRQGLASDQKADTTHERAAMSLESPPSSSDSISDGPDLESEPNDAGSKSKGENKVGHADKAAIPAIQSSTSAVLDPAPQTNSDAKEQYSPTEPRPHGEGSASQDTLNKSHQPKRTTLSLRQRFIDQEREEHNHLVLNAIKFLGDHGVLAEPKKQKPVKAPGNAASTRGDASNSKAQLKGEAAPDAIERDSTVETDVQSNTTSVASDAALKQETTAESEAGVNVADKPNAAGTVDSLPGLVLEADE